MTERVGHVWRVRPGRVAEYDRRHARVWPELETRMRDHGISRYTIYRWGDVVFSHMEVEDYGTLVARYGDDPVARRWEELFVDLLDYPDADAESGWPHRLLEVWNLDA